MNINSSEKTDKRVLWCPIGKSVDGQIQAILSDNSIDRDNEIIGKNLLKKWASDPNRFIPMLVDHKNEIDNLVGKWIEPRILKGDNDHHALTVVPHFFNSNPKTKLVRGLIEDDGAEIGLSIGAIPIKSETVKIDGKKYNKWTDAELVEGSLTPIPSNRNGYMAIAKSFNLKKNEEVSNMTEEEKTTPEETTEETKEEETEEVKETEEAEEKTEETEETEEEVKEEPSEEKPTEKSIKAVAKAEVKKDAANVSKDRISRLKAFSETIRSEKKDVVVPKNASVWDLIELTKTGDIAKKF